MEQEMGAPEADPQAKMIPREAPTPAPAVAAHVKQKLAETEAAKKHFEPVFKRMRADMQFARAGADERWVGREDYIANLIQRHVNQKVAALYAKNPRAVAKRKPRMDFLIWDGSPEALAQARMAVMPPMDPMTGQPADAMMAAAAGWAPDPNAMALLQDVQEGMAHRAMLTKLGKTLEILHHYYFEEQEPTFKTQAKQLVRRTIVTGIGFVDLGFQRLMEVQPDVTAQIRDFSARLAEIERLTANLADGEAEMDSAAAQELQVAIAALQEQEEVIVREGLVYDFPRSHEIVVDPKCRQLQGFIGAQWIARELHMPPEEVQRVYKIDLGKSFKAYKPDDPSVACQDGQAGLAKVYLVQDKRLGAVYALCEGYPDYLKAPSKPAVQLERFWSTYTLSFNDIEDEKEIYPNSDVMLLRSMQEEHNRTRQGLREHRARNRPGWVAAKGKLEAADKTALTSNETNALVELSGMAPQEKIGDVLQAKPTAPIDPSHYDSAPVYEDMLRVVGAQEANLGGTSGATATESSIAETSRSTAVASDVDALDDLLTELARGAGQIMLRELTPETVMKIAGRGAVWPQMSSEEIVEEIYLTVRVGSSGRPNKAVDAANLERLAPTIIQVPGLKPSWLLRKALERLDDDLDIEEAFAEGMPSIVAQNQAAGRPAQPGTGDPASDPGSQGGKGAANAPGAGRNERQAGPQPAMPAPGAPGAPAMAA